MSAQSSLWHQQVQFQFNAALRPQRPYGLLGTVGSPGRPPPLSHSAQALTGTARLLTLMAGATMVDWLLKTNFLPTTVYSPQHSRDASVQKGGKKTSPCHDDRHTRQELWTPTTRSDRFTLRHNTADHVVISDLLSPS